MSYRRDVEDRMENPNLLRDMGINPAMFYYIIVDNGDGSASMRAFKTPLDAEKAAEHELNEYGVGTLSEGVQSFFASNIQEKFDGAE